jgi:hypothetical protein
LVTKNVPGSPQFAEQNNLDHSVAILDTDFILVAHQMLDRDKTIHADIRVLVKRLEIHITV